LLFLDRTLTITNAKWPIYKSKDADFRLVYFLKKAGILPLELYSQALITSSKNTLISPSCDVTSHLKSSKATVPGIFQTKLGDFLLLQMV